MKVQNYKNHKRFYAPHHFIFLPFILICIGVGVYHLFKSKNDQLIWALFTVINVSIMYLVVMLRQHYALTNQNRLVTAEFYLRYFELFGKKYDELNNKLSFSQIAALRFAYDDEFILLVKMAIEQNTEADDLKRLIKNWKPDHLRV